jgi:hypothetical protein
LEEDEDGGDETCPTGMIGEETTIPGIMLDATQELWLLRERE